MSRGAAAATTHVLRCVWPTCKAHARYELGLGDGRLYNRLNTLCWQEGLRERRLPQRGDLPVLEWHFAEVRGGDSDSALKITRLVPRAHAHHRERSLLDTGMVAVVPQLRMVDLPGFSWTYERCATRGNLRNRRRGFTSDGLGVSRWIASAVCVRAVALHFSPTAQGG